MDETELAGHAAHLPIFITAPGHTDWLLVLIGILLVAAVLGLGALFLTIHSLPERIAHRSKKLQLEIVAVLCLLALFTHEHMFWVVALVLAMIDLPDLTSPLKRMAVALEHQAGIPSEPEPETGFEEAAPEPETEAPAPPAKTRKPAAKVTAKTTPAAKPAADKKQES
ncbi:hypothetical protein V6C03_04650 [Methyloligella sp. 2.7D]|uniref:hypothetical protein n=1 Tax=unclassified Methyloligella TaxID=2625955 RepID=UPI00157DEDBD|nr:hypothetical protein [Methyloligella sp. GL2]QKP76115.1 hypothetical protein HT051_00780 [Methyloligella sp. GL2]